MGDSARVRRSTLAMRVLAALLAGWLLAGAHALWTQAPTAQGQSEARRIARALDLTDMAWFTEARYTRHAAVADLHSAFQDGPGLPEHFPAGSLMPPTPRQAAAQPVHTADTGL